MGTAQEGTYRWRPGELLRRQATLSDNDTMPDCILTDLEALRESFAKEARAYTKQGQVPDGARPHEATPWQLACGYMAGTYRVAAHEVGKVIKKHKQK